MLEFCVWTNFYYAVFRLSEKISVFPVTGLKILGRVGTRNFFFDFIFFRKKYMILCILKGISVFKMLKIIFFPRNPEKKL